MLVDKYRPMNLDQLKGQHKVKRILQTIASNPDQYPKSIFMYGGRGTGKTSSARIFARMVNGGSIDDSSYLEYDSTVVGNVETIRELVSSFSMNVSLNGYKVIVFDEIQMASKEAQSALLKILEDSFNLKTFFIFCTTDPDKIIDTIKSRSILVEFNTLPHYEIKEHLKYIFMEETNTDLIDEVISVIYRRTSGHVRDAIQQLEVCKIIGIDEYLSEVTKSDKNIKDFFKQLIVKDSPELFITTVTSICQNPVEYIKQDFYHYMSILSEKIFVKRENLHLKDIIMYYLKYVNNIKTSNDWYIFLMSFYDIEIGSKIESPQKPTGRYNK